MKTNLEEWKQVSETKWTHPSGLSVWIEHDSVSPDVYIIYAQMKDYPASEYHDDWFGKLKDAMEVALDLIKNNPKGE